MSGDSFEIRIQETLKQRGFTGIKVSVNCDQVHNHMSWVLISAKTVDGYKVYYKHQRPWDSKVTDSEVEFVAFYLETEKIIIDKECEVNENQTCN